MSSNFGLHIIRSLTDSFNSTFYYHVNGTGAAINPQVQQQHDDPLGL